MNCLTARETLDLAGQFDARPRGCYPSEMGEEELPAVLIDEAVRHVNGCQACQTAVRRREKIDARIGQLARDVPVPAGLRERLLAQVQTVEVQTVRVQTVRPVAAGTPIAGPSNEGTSEPQPAMRTAAPSRRRLIFSAVAACAVTALSVVVWRLMLPPPPSLTMDEIAEYALSAGVDPAALPVLTQFTGGLEVQLPKTMRELSRTQLVQRLVDPQLGDREIAVYFFMLSGRQGRLAIIPLTAVKDRPAASSFPGPTLYKHGFCTTSWVEGKFVYLCCVRGGEGELHRLRRATNDPA